MEEIWKTIDEYPNYEVSNMGQVRNKITGRILKQCVKVLEARDKKPLR